MDTSKIIITTKIIIIINKHHQLSSPIIIMNHHLQSSSPPKSSSKSSSSSVAITTECPVCLPQSWNSNKLSHIPVCHINLTLMNQDSKFVPLKLGIPSLQLLPVISDGLELTVKLSFQVGNSAAWGMTGY